MPEKPAEVPCAPDPPRGLVAQPAFARRHDDEPELGGEEHRRKQEQQPQRVGRAEEAGFQMYSECPGLQISECQH